MKPVLFFLLSIMPCLSFAQSTNGLVAHWAFDGSAYDSTGKGHNGTMKNVTFAAGKTGAPNTAMRFAGDTNSYVTVSYQPDLNLSKYSICALIKPEGFYTGLCQISLVLTRGPNNTAGNYSLGFSENLFDSSCTAPVDTNKYVFFAAGGPTNYPFHASWHSSPKVHTNQWYSVVGTFDSSVFRIYVNGVLGAVATPQAPVPIGSSTDSLSIGANIFGNSATFPYWYKGLMDDLRIYNRVLADSEIVNYSTLAIEEAKQQYMDLVILPNPNTGSFELRGSINASMAEVEVVNMVGQRIYRNTIRPVNQYLDERIDLSAIAEGTYFVRVAAEGEIKTYRVLVQR